MPKPFKDVKDLKKKGYNWFAAIVSWDSSRDRAALEKFSKDMSHKNKMPSGIENLTVFKLVGERTMLLFGLADSPLSLQQYSAYISFESGIQAKFYHALELNELWEFSNELARKKAR